MATKSDLEIDSFLNEIEQVCRKHGLSISHEDVHGAFVIQKLSEENISWLKEASREAKYQ